MNKHYATTVKVFLLVLISISISSKVRAQSYDWVKGGGSSVDLTPTGRDEQITNMCTDDNGNVYITANIGTLNILADTFYRIGAHTTGLSVVHIFMASYTCNGVMRWAKMLEGTGIAQAGGLEYHNGSVYLAARLASGAFNYKYIGEDTIITSSNLRAFTARFDTGDGHLNWIKFVGPDIPATAPQTPAAGTIAIDGQGYIHNFNQVRAGCTISPSFTTSMPGTYDLKYDTTGNLVSVTHVPALDSVWKIYKAVFNKNSGKWFATIEPEQNYWYLFHADFNSAVCAFKPDNSLVWIDTTGQSGGMAGIAYKGGNDLYVCGNGNSASGPFNIGGITVTNTIGYAHATLFKLDTNDVGKWVYNLMGTTAVNTFYNVTILPNDKIAATGLFAGMGVRGTDTIISTTGEGWNPLLLILDTGGHTIKLDQLHGVGFYDKGTDITSDRLGNVYIGGSLATNMWGGSLTPYVTNGGNTDFFVMKYGYDCSCLTMPPPAASYTHTITSGSSSYTVAFTYSGSTGYDSVRWHFGDGGTSASAAPSHVYTAAGSYTACVTVYTSCGSHTYCSVVLLAPVGLVQASAGSIMVYPNPAQSELVISGTTGTATYRLLSITGAVVAQSALPKNKTINIGALAPGMYILELLQDDGTRNVVRVVKE